MPIDEQTEIAVQARRASAEIRLQLTHLRQSMDDTADRLATLTDPQRRKLIGRACGVVIGAWQVRQAASKLPMTATSTPFLRAIEMECASMINNGADYIHKLTEGRYRGFGALDTALMVARDLEFTEPAKAKPKSTAALRGAAARTAFDKMRRAVKSDEEDQSNDQLCPTCGRPLDPNGDEPEAGSDGKRIRRHKHSIARNLAVIKSAGADEPLTFTGIASSTAVDRSSDRFSKASLVTMRNTFPGTPIHVDHSYKMADLIGKTVSATIKKADDGEYDLWITAELDRSSPKALAVYSAIKNKMPVSLSVGVIVLAQSLTDETFRGKRVWSIDDCEPLEISAVSLPAQARARVTGAKSAILRRKQNDQSNRDQADRTTR